MIYEYNTFNIDLHLVKSTFEALSIYHNFILQLIFINILKPQFEEHWKDFKYPNKKTCKPLSFISFLFFIFFSFLSL